MIFAVGAVAILSIFGTIWTLGENRSLKRQLNEEKGALRFTKDLLRKRRDQVTMLQGELLDVYSQLRDEQEDER